MSDDGQVPDELRNAQDTRDPERFPVARPLVAMGSLIAGAIVLLIGTPLIWAATERLRGTVLVLAIGALLIAFGINSLRPSRRVRRDER